MRRLIFGFKEAESVVPKTYLVDEVVGNLVDK
jgi:hypothetical protein